ncbi:MAG TPA: tetratricopeptide repeat protein [Ramlibacter sp.]|uniref:tetratricopeptide repeat protein n=1 Tax=Ramlibacter sp. TaxID=1917967 RepID=UPI002C1F19F2|nr:tetratricopeptide repeat protein [Ramlibacter sp.]HVZ46110.1 tetratricopeptide repeat protein [Ramlibacter sp.]
METTTPPDAATRLARLVNFLAQDPRNPRLLADAAQAALEAGEIAEAERYVQAGIAEEGVTDEWTFRLASVRIAQRQLAEARALLEALRKRCPGVAGIDHDLAFVALLEGDCERSAQILRPWTSGERDAGVHATAIAAGWLRALHALDRLHEAWRWAQGRTPSQLGAAGTGVASLVAFDLGYPADASRLADRALQSDPRQLEALFTRASIALTHQELETARAGFEEIVRTQPHQARAWTALGILAIVRGDWPAARGAFESSLFAYEEQADAHGALSMVLLTMGERAPAAVHAMRSDELDPGNEVARFMKAILAGDTVVLAELQERARQLMASWPRRH